TSSVNHTPAAPTGRIRSLHAARQFAASCGPSCGKLMILVDRLQGAHRMSKARTDLLQGTLDLLILKTLALGPQHGWGISQRIQQISDDVLRVNQRSLYPALHRLEVQGWVTSEWGTSENNRDAKFYRLTRAGLKQ